LAQACRRRLTIERPVLRTAPAAHDEIPRVGIGHLFLLDAAANIPNELEIESLSEAACDLALRFGEVSALGLESIGPNMRTAFRVDQLNIHPNLIAGPPDAALEDIAGAEVSADLLHVGRLAFISEGPIAGDHEAPGNPR